MRKIMRHKNIFLTLAASLVFGLLVPVSQAQNRNPSRSINSNRLTGTYQLIGARSDDPTVVADRVSRNIVGRQQGDFRNRILNRLEAPQYLTLDVQGRLVTMASSSRLTPVTFEADGRNQSEPSQNGRMQRINANLNGERLVVSTNGDQSLDYQLTFEVIDNGRSLRVTRSIADENLRQPVVARSVYYKSSDRPDWNFRYADVSSPRNPRRGTDVPDGTLLTATFNDDLSTRQAQSGDQFTLYVQTPGEYQGATIEGHVVTANRSRQVSGRAEMGLDFDRIRMRDGRSADFAGTIESIRTTNGQNVRVDSEGVIQNDTSQTNRTVTRTGIGAAIGAVIRAIAGGGKGAAIGAGVGAGAGAGSVFIQGADDLDLTTGTEVTIRASSYYD